MTKVEQVEDPCTTLQALIARSRFAAHLISEVESFNDRSYNICKICLDAAMEASREVLDERLKIKPTISVYSHRP